MKKILAIVFTLILFGSCSPKIVTVKETEFVHITDTTFIRDTTIQYQIEKERYTSYTGLLDTLRLSTDYAKAEAYIDTTANLLKGSIESKPEKQIEIRWKERLVRKDSIIVKEVPVTVEVIKEKKFVPGIYRWGLGTAVVLLVLILGWTALKIYLKFK